MGGDNDYGSQRECERREEGRIFRQRERCDRQKKKAMRMFKKNQVVEYEIRLVQPLK